VALFLSTFVNKVDRKGRVSVPAAFRTVLATQSQSFQGIVAYRGFNHPVIEASGMDWIEELSRRLDTLDELSEERDALSALFADVQQLPFDGEGRIVLPEALVAHAGITENAAFVGNSGSFQIWEPERFARHQDERRALVRERGLTLPARRLAVTGEAR
jgi:MraZ protein